MNWYYNLNKIVGIPFVIYWQDVNYCTIFIKDKILRSYIFIVVIKSEIWALRQGSTSKSKSMAHAICLYRSFEYPFKNYPNNTWNRPYKKISKHFISVIIPEFIM